MPENEIHIDIVPQQTSINAAPNVQQSNIDINYTYPGAMVWGNITGTLSDQTDLQNALDAKVSKSGDTMNGHLSFGDFSISSDDGLAKIEGTQYGLRVDTTTGLGAALLTANGLGDVLTSLNVQSTYSSTGMDPVNGTAVASAISGKQNALTSCAGYDAAKTQVLKNINGTLTWVDEV